MSKTILHEFKGESITHFSVKHRYITINTPNHLLSLKGDFIVLSEDRFFFDLFTQLYLTKKILKISVSPSPDEAGHLLISIKTLTKPFIPITSKILFQLRKVESPNSHIIVQSHDIGTTKDLTKGNIS